MAKAKTRSSRGVARRPSLLRSLFGLVLIIGIGAAVFGALALASYTRHLDGIIRAQFEGKRWAVPARVYARPLEFYPGQRMHADAFERELQFLRYRADAGADQPGSYSRSGEEIDVHTRSFGFWDGEEPVRRLKVAFRDGAVQGVSALDGQPVPGLIRLEPMEIAGIYPAHKEDRVLVRRDELPPQLVGALLAVEDRSFFDHWGIDLKGISRAMIANLRAGRTVQGGSTLTQQLVKNFFLSNERTLERKLNEMLMAVLIDWHYSKDEILEAYANEVYLGQDGSRAIHGLGLASRFFFDRQLAELEPQHMALLVGLVRGPSYYDPRRQPQRATDRRALVLDLMAEHGVITAAEAAEMKLRPLGVVARATRQDGGLYPGFIDLVQRQLREDYPPEVLSSEGLRIFTTLDPLVQAAAEDSVGEWVPKLEQSVKLENGLLQGAALVTDSQTGEVLALLAGRDPRLAGFNRVLDAQRPAGSLLKPAVFLTALERPERFTLATPISDDPFTYVDRQGKKWSPGNYDKRNHGVVTLQDALAQSYNIPTARIGLDLGPEQVVATLQRLGLRRDLAPYPSLFLGAVDLSPFEIGQVYQTLATGGFRTPLRAIREVTDAGGQPMQRYALAVDKVVEPGPAYLVTRAMQRVVSHGTGRYMNKFISPRLGVAGKTGTTDDLRDSWFAGFSGNMMAVVWLGRDDNKPAKLSGSTGALRLWTDMMSRLPLEPLEPVPSSDVEMAWVDAGSGGWAYESCEGAEQVPFLAGSTPRHPAPCVGVYEDGRGGTPWSGAPGGGFEPIQQLLQRLLQ